MQPFLPLTLVANNAMSDGHTVLHVPSIDELNYEHDLPIDEPEIGEDWGLVTHTDSYTRITFVHTGETISIPTEQYFNIRDEYDPATEYRIENATETVARVGENAIFAAAEGQPILEDNTNELPRLVAAVFVMQHEQDRIDWPGEPEPSTA